MLIHTMRHRLATLLALPPRDRAFLATAWIWLLVADVALWFLPLSGVRRLLSPAAPPRRPAGEAVPVERLARLVELAARHHLYPMTCLRRALVLERCLGQRGLAADLRIGVRREGSRLYAHAWVELGGRPVAEPREATGSFTPLLGRG
jgi:hypothetical protein